MIPRSSLISLIVYCVIFDNKNIVKNGVQRGYAISHGYKALSGGTGTQVRVSIMSLFLTVLCRFAKGKAAVQTPQSNKRQKGVVVWKLRMDTLPAPTSSSTTALDTRRHSLLPTCA